MDNKHTNIALAHGHNWIGQQTKLLPSLSRSPSLRASVCACVARECAILAEEDKLCGLAVQLLRRFSSSCLLMLSLQMVTEEKNKNHQRHLLELSFVAALLFNALDSKPQS